ncbi:MAG: hypothetical protein QG584_2428 [Pseudomonadota bacterium]|nr:hypothetical protein [Pseudomonadota bacterium]MDQ5919130.1 hypothetical protein [Pseudomonadota bacterium]
MPFVELIPPDRDSLPPATTVQNKETGMSFRAMIVAFGDGEDWLRCDTRDPIATE